MATVTFTALGEIFSLSDSRVEYVSNVFVAQASVWGYASATDDWAGFRSATNDLQFSGADPFSGTVTSFEFWRGAPGPLHDLQFSITGLSLDFATLAPLAGSLSDEQENNLVWRLLLAGDDTIDFGSYGNEIIFAGDGRNVEFGQVLTGGADSFTGSAGTSGYVYGDYNGVLGIAHGGADTITATGHMISGDANDVFAGGLLIGGNDSIASTSSSYAIGDATSVLGTLIAGHDTIDAAFSEEAYGDAFVVGLGAVLIGGNDSITGGAAGQVLSGDGNNSAGANVQAGDDTVSGGGGGDTIYGDFNSGSSVGGKDHLYGDAGNDTIHGNGGNDAITGGADTDALYGEDGNDIFYLDLVAEVAGNETMDGGNGADTIVLYNGLNGYSYDLRGVTLTSIEAILFRETFLSVGSAQVNASQFGVGLLSLNAAVVGYINGFTTDRLVVTMDQDDLDLSGLVFTSFNGPDEFVTITSDDFALDFNSITGTDVNDSISAGAGDDTLSGGDGNDTIRGGFGEDTVNGGNGNDVFQVLEGEYGDHVDGGADTDTLDLSGLAGTTTATVNLSLSTDNWRTSEPSSPDFDIVNVENVIGGAGNDTITANGALNSLVGGAGNDSIIINLADIVANQVDVFDGGDNVDALIVDTPGMAHTANLRSISILNIERLVFDDPGVGQTATIQLLASQIGAGKLSALGTVQGVGFGDTNDILDIAMGTSSSLDLSGMDFSTFGSDVSQNDYVIISGGTVSSTIIGSDVNDSITGSALKDTIKGGLGKDTLNGGAGTGDTLDYSDKSQSVVLTLGAAGVTVNGLAEDTISGFEHVIGGTGDDDIFGDGQANTITGGGGTDYIDAGGGNDRIVGSAAGTSLLIGGSGRDTVVAGAGAGDNVFIMDTHEDALGESYDGGGGADDFIVTQGSDGGYSIDLRNDALAGFEQLAIFDSGGAVVGRTGTVRLTATQLAPIVGIQGSADPNAANVLDLTMGTVSTLNLTAKGFDVTMSDIRDKVVINGDDDAENITGSSIRDSILGGNGNDTFRGGLSNDTLNGGANTDTADYAEKTTKVTVTLDNSGNGTAVVTGADTDTLAAIENAIGGTAGDSFTGGSAANVFRGNGGNDTLNGGTGVDTADLSDKTAKVTVVLDNSGNGTAVVTGGDTDTLTAIENAIGGSAGDSFTGGSAASVFTGNNGNDTFKGGLGNDTLNGGNHTDTADYSDKATKVTVVLDNSGNGSAVVTGADTDGLLGIENLIGGSAGDAFTGGSANNSFRGNGGNDTLNGGAGIDTADFGDKITKVTIVLNNSGNGTAVVTGADTDTLTAIENALGGSAGDSFTGGSANNLFRGGAGKDTMDGGAGLGDTADYAEKAQTVKVTLTGAVSANVFINGNAAANIEDSIKNFEHVNGGSNNDTLTGDIAANMLSGNAGLDTLNGGNGNDTLIGGLGNDALTGGANADVFRFTGALGATNIDTVADFTTAQGDKLQLDKAIFAAIATVGAGLDVGEFRKGAGITTAADANDYVIYNTTDGKLYYDAGGAGGAAAVHFATLTTKPGGLAHTDFTIV